MSESSGSYERLILEREGATAIITLNHPPANAMDERLLDDFNHAMDAMEKDTSLRVVIVTGGGGRMFSAGADITMLAKSTGDDIERLASKGTELTNRIEAFSRPFIAAVNGMALGGGNELALACDLRMCVSSARFGLPEINLGLIPGWGGITRLAKVVGKARASEIIMTGRMVPASEALSLGIVTKVCADLAELMTEAKALAAKLSGQAPLALAEIKSRIVNGLNEPVAEGVRNDVKAFARNARRKDAKEGIAAFLEKRKPTFQGE